jgi:aldehyde dehydrogenase (NAD+)
MNQFQEIFDKQKAYFDSDATKSYEWRIDQLTRLENLCNENAEVLEAAMSSDFKTASQEKVFEIMAPVGTVAFAKQDLKEWMKPVDVVVPKALRESGHTAKVYREPYGVTLVIGPFNGPLTLLFDPAVQVIAAGNPCILKLSEGLPATSKVLLDLIPKYFDPRAVTAVTGSKDEVTELLKLPFDFIFFTGSVKVGKIVMEAAAKNLTPVLLELGGQNPAFVDATANIPDAAKKIVWGATAWGGQWCTSPGYAYVHESIAEEFVAECKKAMVELYGTDPKSRPDDYSRIISPKATERLAGLIDQKKVVIGGGLRPGGTLSRSHGHLSSDLGRSDHGGRDLWAASSNPHLQGHGCGHSRGEEASEASFRLPLQPRSAGDRSLPRKLVLRRRRDQSGKHSPVYRNHALWRGRIFRYRSLLRQGRV